MTILHLCQTRITLPVRTVTSYSAFPNRASIWLCPILSAQNEFD